MAGQKLAQYTVGVDFQVDTKGLQSSIAALRQEMDFKKFQNLHLDLDINDAKARYSEIMKTEKLVRQALEKSYDIKLNTYDFSKFTAALKNVSFNKVTQDFTDLGAAGQRALLDMTKAFTTTNVQLTQTHTLLEKMGTTLANTLRWQAATKAIQSVSGSIQQAYYFTKDLDKSLNDIRIVTDKSTASMEKFTAQAISAAKALGKSTTDYTNASLLYYQQGLSDEEVAQRTETTLKVANVTGQAASTVSEELTAVWNGYQIELDKTEESIDKLAAVAANSASDLEEISTAMSKVASAANMTGVNIDQLTAQIATIVSVTRQAPETVGTALKTIYARISDLKLGETDEEGVSLGDVSSDLHSLGVEILDSTGELRDLGTVIEEIAAKWDLLSNSQKTALAQSLGGKRQYTNLVALFESWDMYNKNLQISEESLGTLQRQQDTYMEGTKAHLQALATAKEELYASFMDEDTINKGADALKSMVESVTKIVKTLGGGKGVFNTISGILMMALKAPLGKAIGTALTNRAIRADNQRSLDYVTKSSAAIQGVFAQQYNKNSAQQAVIAADFNQDIVKYTNDYKNNTGMTVEQYNALCNAAYEYRKALIDLQKVEEKNEEAKRRYRDIFNKELEYDTNGELSNAHAELTAELKKEQEALNQARDALLNYEDARDKLEEQSSDSRYKAIKFELKDKLAAQGITNTDKYSKNAQLQLESIEKKKSVTTDSDEYNRYKKIEEALREYIDALAELDELNKRVAQDENKLTDEVNKHTEKVKERNEAIEALENTQDASQQKRNVNDRQRDKENAERNANNEMKGSAISDFVAGVGTSVAAFSTLNNVAEQLAKNNTSLLSTITAISFTLPQLIKGIKLVAATVSKIKLGKYAKYLKDYAEKFFNNVNKNGLLDSISKGWTKITNKIKASELTATQLGAFAGLGALAAYTLINTYVKTLRKEKQKIIADTENAVAVNQRDNFSNNEQELKQQDELYRALVKAQKAYNDQEIEKEELNKTTIDLLSSYEDEQVYVDYLLGKYHDLTTAMRELNKEKRAQIIEDAKSGLAQERSAALATFTMLDDFNAIDLIQTTWNYENTMQMLLDAFGSVNNEAIIDAFLGENREESIDIVRQYAKEHSVASPVLKSIEEIYSRTKENYEASKKYREELENAENNEKFSAIFGNDILEYSDKNLASLGEQYKTLSAEEQDKASQYIKNAIGARELQNVKLASLSDELRLSANDIVNMTDNMAAAYLQSYDAVGDFGDAAVEKLTKVKIAELDAADAATALNETLSLLTNFNITNGIRDSETLKNTLKESYDEFEAFLQDNNVYDAFFNNLSPEEQLQQISDFYDKRNQQIIDKNREIEEYNKSLPDYREKLKQQIEQLQENPNAEAYNLSDLFLRVQDDNSILYNGTHYRLNQDNQLQFAYNGKWSDMDTQAYKPEYAKDLENYLKALNNVDNVHSDKIAKLNEELNNLSEKPLEEVINKWNKELALSNYYFQIANNNIDNLQSAYSSLNDIIDTYNSTGAITIDQMQTIVQMDYDQLQYLEIENNKITLNTEAMNENIKASIRKAKAQVVENAYSLISAIHDGNLAKVKLQLAYSQDIATKSIDENSEAMLRQIGIIEQYMSSMTGEDLEIANQIYEQMDKKLKVFDMELAQANVLTAGVKDNEEDTLKTVEAELDIYHDINIELEKINKATERLKKTRDKLIGQDLLNSYADEITLLNTENNALERKLALQQQDAADKRAELGAHGVAFDANGQVANYNTILQRWADQVNATTDKDQREVMEEQRQKLVETLKEYEDLWNNEIEEVKDKLTDNSAAIIQAQVDRMNIVVDTTIDLKDLKRKFNEFKRDYIDKLLPTEFAKAVDTINKNMSATYQAMGMNYEYVTKALAEVQKMQQGMVSDLYGDNINLALEDLQSNSEKLQELMKEVTEDLVAATDKYRESIDELSSAFERQTEYLEKLAGVYDKQTKAYQLLYGENGAAAMAAQNLEKIADIYNAQGDKYMQQANYWQTKISEWEATVNDPSTTAEVAQALNEQIKDAQDKMIDANEKAGEAYVNAVEKANEGFAQRIAAENNKLAEGILGQSLNQFKTDWEATKELSDMYYDNVNRAYQTSLLMGKYQKSINENTGTAQQKLQNAYDKELATLKEKDKLTKYDLERAEKRYQLVLAQIALEEAQQNKSTLKLARDSQGNYTYQYMSDPTAINDAQEKVNSLANDIYNLDKDNWRANTEAIIADLEKLSQKAAEAFRIFGTDSDEANEVVAKYYEKLNELAKQRVTIAGNSEESMVSELKRIADSDDVAQLIGNKEYQLEREKYTELANANLLKMEEALVNNLSNEKNRLNQDLILKNAELTDDVEKNLDKNFIKWSDTNERINTNTQQLMANIDGQLVNLQDATDQVLIAIEERNLQVLGTIQENSGLAVDSYEALVDEITNELIPAHDKYIDELQQEVDFTGKALNACEDLARKYVNLYDSGGKVVERTEEIITTLKKLDALPEIKKHNTITTEYKVIGKDKNGGLDKPIDNGDGSFTTDDGEYVKVGETYLIPNVHYTDVGKNGDNAPDIPMKKGSGIYTLSNAVTAPYAVHVTGGLLNRSGYISYIDFINLASLYGNMDLSKTPISYQANANNGKNGMSTDAYQADVTYMDGTIKTMNYKQAVALMKDKKQKWTFDTGGYTGSWVNGDNEGRMAMLHQKEIVLNATDTANLLDMVKYQREMLMIERDAALNKVSAVNESLKSNGGIINPVYNITASFPNAVDHNEIELAILDLPNFAAQRANSNLM